MSCQRKQFSKAEKLARDLLGLVIGVIGKAEGSTGLTGFDSYSFVAGTCGRSGM